MDIGFYCLASAVALFGEPKSVQATASLLASGVDAHGVVVMDYGDFSVTLQHSKVVILSWQARSGRSGIAGD